MKLVYIAGPYRPVMSHGAVDVTTEENIKSAEAMAIRVVDKVGQLNWFPVTPHLCTRDFENLVKTNDDLYFLNGTMALMEKCDAVLLTFPEAAQYSSGTRAEVARANELGLPVFTDFATFVIHCQSPTLRNIRSVVLPALTVDQAAKVRADFLKLLPQVAAVWDSEAGTGSGYDYSKLEERVLGNMAAGVDISLYGAKTGRVSMNRSRDQSHPTMEMKQVAAIHLMPGDVVLRYNPDKSPINSVNQADNGYLMVTYRNGGTVRFWPTKPVRIERPVKSEPGEPG